MDTELEFHKMEELWAQMVLMVTERVNGLTWARQHD